MVANPCERQVSERDVIRGQLVEGNGIGSSTDRTFVTKHHTFGCAGRARCIKDNGWIGAFAGGDVVVEPSDDRRVTGKRFAPIIDHVIH